MSESIDCLLDANSIIKYYHDELGSNIIEYLFDNSLTAQINILNLHIPEVVSVFHKLRLKNGIKSDNDRDIAIDTFLKDIFNEKMVPYMFGDKHFEKVYYNFNLAYTIPPPARRFSYIPFKRGYVIELKDLADTNDIAMLTIMQEITGIVGESYLFSSDGHVIEIAKAMGLGVLDPEKMTFGNIPYSLDRRSAKREQLRIKAVCQDCETTHSLGSERTIDICCNGACISLSKKIETRRRIITKLKRDNIETYIYDIESEVVWSDGEKIGVRFLNPDNISLIPFK